MLVTPPEPKHFIHLHIISKWIMRYLAFKEVTQCNAVTLHSLVASILHFLHYFNLSHVQWKF